jgi:tryptophan 2,3-dioxygenase
METVPGELTSNAPRDYIPLTDRERAAKAATTGGEPVLDFGVGSTRAESTAYIDYHNVDVVLAQQHPRSSEPAELSFLTMGQVQELLFKLLFTDISLVRDLLFDDRLDEALWRLRRVERNQRVLVATWEPLSTITPREFAAFRDQLGDASGLQSYMYRQLEFVLGHKSARLAEAHSGVTWVYKQVDAALRAPSLYDAAIAFLRAHGADIPDACVHRDYAEPYQPHPAVEHAWAEIYRAPGENHDGYLLAEALSDLSYQYSRWRYTHLLSVERVIGSKPGTGGTHGVRWLAKIADHRFFPELWTARTAV